MFALAMDEEDEIKFFDDPRSSSFGQMQIGDVRVDYMGGLAQFATLMARVTSGQKMTRSGKIVPIRGKLGFGQDDAYDVLADFAKTKFTPPIGIMVDYLSGTNIIGEERKFGADPEKIWTLSQYFLPISGVEIIETMREDGFLYGAIKAPLTSLGIRINKEQQRRSYLY
jgi:hypothetical protein